MNVGDFLQLMSKISQQQNIRKGQERNVTAEVKTVQKAPDIEGECPEKDVTENADRNTDGLSNFDSAAILNKVETK